jgi:ubiquinone/menaquinone biosynthesis C-methylase UbiE
LTTNHHAHKRFSDKLAFLLNNPVRRRLSPPERLISKLDIDREDVVVDFGCGPGFFLIPVAKITGKAIGIDTSTRMLELASNYAGKRKVSVELLQSDGREIKIPVESVNLIFLVHVFHEVHDQMALLKEFLRILKPLGRVAIVEKTRAGRVYIANFGPPVVNEMELAQQIQKAGFTVGKPIPHGRDSIIIGKKMNTQTD